MIRQHPSPNQGPRWVGLLPRFVILHYTAMASAEAARARLSDPAAEVSSHYLIAQDGQILQLVAEHNRAWHAGAGAWHGLHDINSRSIGIELDNDGQTPFTRLLMRSLETLLADILHRWAIPPQNVIGHSDMAPGRKIDPGPLFDWPRLAALGLAAPANATPGTTDLTQFRSRARAAGYTADADDADLLQAIRLRWRPKATGPLSPEDIAVLPVSSGS